MPTFNSFKESYFTNVLLLNSSHKKAKHSLRPDVVIYCFQLELN